MSGYEIQHLSYKTLKVKKQRHQITGEEASAPNGFSLLQRDFSQEKFRPKWWISILQTALIYDTRDFEPDPTKVIILK
jgi:outer membrane protein assembly factor BamA